MTSDGTKRGKSDANIDNGDDPADLAKEILDAIKAKTPELIFAKGTEYEAAKLRQSDPDTLFTMMNQMGAQIAARYEEGDDA